MFKGSLVIIGVVAVLILVSGGMDTDPGKKGFERPRRTETPEYNCLHHARDGICEVPMENGKVVLYCVDGAFKRIVHYREDCK
jgi:hypothetical protein